MDNNKIKESILNSIKEAMLYGMSLDLAISSHLEIMQVNLPDDDIEELLTAAKDYANKIEESHKKLESTGIKNVRVFNAEVTKEILNKKNIKLVKNSLNGKIKIKSSGMKIVKPPVEELEFRHENNHQKR